MMSTYPRFGLPADLRSYNLESRIRGQRGAFGELWKVSVKGAMEVILLNVPF